MGMLRKCAAVAALIVVLASGGVAWAADQGDRGSKGPAATIWERVWSEVRGWLGVLDGSANGAVEGEGNPEPSVPLPVPPGPGETTSAETDHGPTLDPNG